MTDESPIKTDPTRPQESPSPSYGDPVRRTFGDKPNDAGEGHKGPRVDATTVPTDTRPQGDRKNPTNQASQATQKAPQANVHGGSGSECSTTAGKETEAKPALTQGGSPSA